MKIKILNPVDISSNKLLTFAKQHIPQFGFGDVVVGLKLGSIVSSLCNLRNLDPLGILHEIIHQFGVKPIPLRVASQPVQLHVSLVGGVEAAVSEGALGAIVILVLVLYQADLHSCAKYASFNVALVDLVVALSLLKESKDC